MSKTKTITALTEMEDSSFYPCRKQGNIFGKHKKYYFQFTQHTEDTRQNKLRKVEHQFIQNK
jgi:hypothetical protein